MKIKNKIILPILILLIFVVIYLIVGNKKSYSIFSIPEDTTPTILQSKGFGISRNTNFFGQIDEDHKGEVEYCRLDLGTCKVHISFRDNDTTKIGYQAINIDFLAFKQMTKLTPKAYKSVEIEGVKYKITLSPKVNELYMVRLGLKRQ